MAPSTPKKKQLSCDQRRDIRALKSTNMTHQQVIEHLLFVYNIIITVRQVSLACTADHPTPEKRTGRPPLLWPERVEILINFVRSSRLARQMTYFALSLYFHAWNCTEYAIRGALRRAGFKRYIARYKCKLSLKK
jgi:hypothetical protein